MYDFREVYLILYYSAAKSRYKKNSLDAAKTLSYIPLYLVYCGRGFIRKESDTTTRVYDFLRVKKNEFVETLS